MGDVAGAVPPAITRLPSVPRRSSGSAPERVEPVRRV